MKEISLSKGKRTTLVDDEDYEYLNQWNWYYTVSGYVVRKLPNPSKIYIPMHRVIMNPPIGMMVDHINHNGLDNRKCNLRICTNAENQHNRKIGSNNTSGYKGVSWNTLANKWEAQVKFNNKKIYLGRFISLEHAVKTYNKRAKELFGEFALINSERKTE